MKGETVVKLDKEHSKILKAVANEAECSPQHAVKWAIRTLADKRGIKISSFSRIPNQKDCTSISVPV